MKIENGQLSVIKDRLMTWSRVTRAYKPAISHRTLKCNDVLIVIDRFEHDTIRVLTKFGVAYIHKNDFLIERQCG